MWDTGGRPNLYRPTQLYMHRLYFSKTAVCPPSDFGVSPEIHPFCAVGVSLSTTLTVNFKQNDFKTASFNFCRDFPDFIYDSKTSVRRMKSAVNHRI
jgi:hypothetical protein